MCWFIYEREGGFHVCSPYVIPLHQQEEPKSKQEHCPDQLKLGKCVLNLDLIANSMPDYIKGERLFPKCGEEKKILNLEVAVV